MSLLSIKSKDNMGPACALGQPPERPGRNYSFCGLVANFYSLRQNSCWKVGIRWSVRFYRLSTIMGILHSKESGSLLVMTGGLLAMVTRGLSQLQRWPWLWALLLWPWHKGPHLWPRAGLHINLQFAKGLGSETKGACGQRLRRPWRLVWEAALWTHV